MKLKSSYHSPSSRASFGCDGTIDLHHGHATNKSIAALYSNALISVWTKISEEVFQHCAERHKEF